MDLSGLIFVALAVAWAAYLIPKALKHHEDVVRSRSVERFSDSMRVLARREPINRRNARLVVTPGRPAAHVEVAVKGEARVADAPAARRSTRGAARRRRRVLLLLLLANVAVVAVATSHVISWWWVAAPAGLLLAWLVACRLMVRHERAGRSVVDQVVEAFIEDSIAETAERPAIAIDEETGEIVAVDADLWDPVPVTLPTYVGKPAARRTVRTIDLDATGVWTSGRSEADSQLAREAEESLRQSQQAAADERDRAIGSA